MRNSKHVEVEREAPATFYLPAHPGAHQTRHSRVVKDDFTIETFTLPLEAARGKVREILNRTTKNGHLEVVESWRQLSDGKIEFTTRLWPTADQGEKQFLDDVTVNRGAQKMLDVVERTKAIVVEQLVVDPDVVTESAHFMEDLGADSLDMVELAIKFEREFGLEISDEAAESIRTVGDAVKFLETHAFA